MIFRNQPLFYRKSIQNVDVAMIRVTPMDQAGKSTWQRAEALINIAHPSLRDELVKEAQEMNIWRKRK